MGTHATPVDQNRPPSRGVGAPFRNETEIDETDEIDETRQNQSCTCDCVNPLQSANCPFETVGIFNIQTSFNIVFSCLHACAGNVFWIWEKVRIVKLKISKCGDIIHEI